MHLQRNELISTRESLSVNEKHDSMQLAAGNCELD